MQSTASILQALKARGLSQCEITRRTGVPQSRLSRWQRGLVPPALEDDLKLRRLHAELVEGVKAEPAAEPEPECACAAQG